MTPRDRTTPHLAYNKQNCELAHKNKNYDQKMLACRGLTRTTDQQIDRNLRTPSQLSFHIKLGVWVYLPQGNYKFFHVVIRR
jgi:hypothetical protein